MTEPSLSTPRLLVVLAFAAITVGCGQSPETTEEETAHATETDDREPGGLPDTLETLDYKVETEVLAENLIQPWAIDFLGPDTALVTEQPGRLRLLVDGELLPDSIAGTPLVFYQGQERRVDFRNPVSPEQLPGNQWAPGVRVWDAWLAKPHGASPCRG